MGKDNTSFFKRMKYKFDVYMSKGPRAQFVLLFVVFFILIFIMGIIIALVNGEHFGLGMWQTLMHMLDQGTIAGDDVSNYPYVFIMLAITICGMVLTGAIIAIINNALEIKLEDLRKGKSRIIESGHTVVIGFDENVYCILHELMLANENCNKTSCVVVLDEKFDKETMEQLISDHFKNDKNVQRLEKKTKIICRSGSVVQEALYGQASIETAKSVIINNDDDFQVIRIVLAVTTYLKCRNVFSTAITTLLHNEGSLDAAEFAVEDFPNARILYFEDILARIMAQVCRQPGLSSVLSELFSYEGQELYLESQHNGDNLKFVGTTFAEVLTEFENATVIGMKSDDGKIVINPKSTTKVKNGDTFLLLANDDNEVNIVKPNIKGDINTLMQPITREVRPKSKFLILDWNKSLPTVLTVLNDFVSEGSSALIVSNRQYNRKKLDELDNLANLTVKFKKESKLYNLETLRRLLKDDYTNILLVCEDGIDKDIADAQTALLLLHIREIISEETNSDKYKGLTITSEMNTTDDQKLLQVANVNDFVVGSEIANRIMAQVSNQPELQEIYFELLDASGSEIYLRPVSYYVKPEVQNLTFADITSVVYNFIGTDGHPVYDIPIGYKIGSDIKLNPLKSQVISNVVDIQLIIVSKGDSKGHSASIATKEKIKHIREIDINDDLDGALQEIKDVITKRLT